MDPLIIAIPLFLALTAVEAVALHRSRPDRHKLGDLVSGIGCGALDQLVNLTVGAGFIAAYVVLERNVGLLELSPRSIPGWIAAVLLHDLCYYLFHRASHRVNALWAAHAVHHQSEDYSFAVSLRQGTIATWVSYVFYLPMALVGVPAEVFVIVHGAYQVYQFFVHTRFIPALGPLERVLATPVLHRVHHGRDADFLDKNYGGFFVIWDKLFGTFAPYTREPDYGVVAGIRSWSPLWANLHPYAELVRRARRAPSPRAALAVWLRPPEWIGPWETREPPTPGYGPAVPRAAAAYSLVQLATAVAATLALLWPDVVASGAARLALGAFVVVTLMSVAAIHDRKPWAPRLEAVRLGAITGSLLAVALSAVFIR